MFTSAKVQQAPAVPDEEASAKHPHPHLSALMNAYDRCMDYKYIKLAFNMYDRISFMADTASDVLLCITFYQQRQLLYSLLSAVFIIVPYSILIIAAYFTYRRYMDQQQDTSESSLRRYPRAGLDICYAIFFLPIVIFLALYYHLRFLLTTPEEDTPDFTTQCYYNYLRTFTKTCIESFAMSILQFYLTIQFSSSLSDSAYIILVVTLALSVISVIQAASGIVSDARARGLSLYAYIYQLCTMGITSAPMILAIRKNTL